MPYTNVGNRVGTSKTGGLFKKFESEGSDMKLLRFGDFLKGSEPYITKDINSGNPVDRDAWVRMYLNNSSIAAKKRLEDTARISKFVASPRGVLWEADMAALEAIQKKGKLQQQERIQKIQSAGTLATEGENFWKSLGKNLLSTVVNLGKAALQGIGLTAATLTQVAASGTGFHNDTYISRAYLTDGSSVLNQILSYAGITTGGAINGAAAVLGGATDILGDEPWKKLPDESKMVPNSVEKVGSHKPFQTYGTVSAGSFRGILGESRKNYEGKRIRSGSYSDSDLRGVSAVAKHSRNVRGPMASVVLADRDNLQLSMFGRVVDKESVIQAGKVAEWSEARGTSVAKSYEEEESRYLKDTSIGTGKEGQEIPYRVNTNLDTGSIISLYDFKEPKQYLNGDEWEPPQKNKEVITVKVGEGERRLSGLSKDRRYTRDSIEEFVYDVKELPVLIDSGEDLRFKSENLSKSLGLIPFCITTITPDHRTYLNFPAFLDSYEDSYDGEWDSVRYVGRAENFYGYKGFKRSISLSFKVIARNLQQLEPLYRKLNKLVGATAPSYDRQQLFMRGTLSSLTIGGWHEGALLKEKLGIIPNVKLSWENDVPWEINLDEEAKEKTGYQFVVPHALNVSLTFIPIEDQEPREDYDAYFVFDPKKRSEVVGPELDTAEPERERRTPATLPEPQPVQPQIDTLDVVGSGNMGSHANTGISREQIFKEKVIPQIDFDNFENRGVEARLREFRERTR